MTYEIVCHIISLLWRNMGEIYPEACASEISRLKSMLVNNDFQTWHLLAGGTTARQSETMLKSLLLNMEFKMDLT